MSLAVTKRKKSVIVLAWIAPIVAIIISITMVYDHYKQIGNDIEITFHNIDGLDVRQSHIQLNGLHIGNINSMKLDPNNINNFIVQATIYADYNYLVTKGSLFYKVSPKVSLNEISALGNVLKGNYIELVPATSDIAELKQLEKQLLFQGYDEKPKTKGIIFTINSNDGGFGLSSSILFKGLQIGEVLNKTINDKQVQYQVLIYEQYKYLISSTTQFYTINPFELKASLEEINIKVPSVKNILSSAIGFHTPSYDEEIKESYDLYPSKELISLEENNKKYFTFRILANGISQTDFIVYKGVIVGQIDKVKLGIDKNEVTGKIYTKYKYLVNNSTYFYKPKALKTNLSTQGLKVEIPAIKEILLGGLSFKTPNKKAKLSSKVFSFYEDIDTVNESKKFTITLNTRDNHNIKTTSKLYYKNIAIADVTKISLEDEIKITIQGDVKYKKLFGKNSKIYLEGTKISLEEIKNLSSTILGDNLYLIADKNNSFKSKYLLDSVNPDNTYYKKGLRVELRANDSKNITVGSPIYYKGFEVGEIYDAKLVENGEYILFSLFIEDRYKNILKTSSRFFKSTIIDMDVGIFGANIKMGSTKSILKGGIFFQNLSPNQKTVQANTNTIFKLEEKEE